jgi:ABC-2 type transport system ATP-binding protein
MEPILECNGLSKTYNGGHSYALNNLNLILEPGQIVGLLGPNGSGKTTLIKLLNDCLVPSAGSIRIGGNEVGVESKKIISYLPEKTYLDGGMRVKDILSYFEDFYEDFQRDRALRMLADLGINENMVIKTLSKGTQEKFQLVLVMSRDAKLYILDEPIGGVDPAARDYILRTILNNYREDATLLLSTHLIGDIETYLDRVLFLQYGELVLNTTVDEIRQDKGKSVDALFREVFRC